LWYVPLIVVLFMPGYTLSSRAGIPGILHGNFRYRDAENAPAGAQPAARAGNWSVCTRCRFGHYPYSRVKKNTYAL
jgi:hypothetical protein